MIIDSMYKRTFPMPPAAAPDNAVDRWTVVSELQSLWDQLDKTHRSLEEVHRWQSSALSLMTGTIQTLREANDVLNERVTELEKELYGE